MARNNMTTSEIENELNELGDTGAAEIRGNGLYVQRAENADWQYVGSVDNEAQAKEAIRQFFNR